MRQLLLLPMFMSVSKYLRPFTRLHLIDVLFVSILHTLSRHVTIRYALFVGQILWKITIGMMKMTIALLLNHVQFAGVSCSLICNV